MAEWYSRVETGGGMGGSSPLPPPNPSIFRSKKEEEEERDRRKESWRTGIILCSLIWHKDYFEYDNTIFASSYSGGQGALTLTKDHVKVVLTDITETMMCESRAGAGIADYVDNTSASGHASVYGLAMCTSQMLAEDCYRCSLDQLLVEFNNTMGRNFLILHNLWWLT